MKHPIYHTNLPATVRFDARLSPYARLLYGDIKALCDQQGYCWASNRYLASLYGVKAKVASRWIQQLRKYGYLKIAIQAGNQRKIFVQSDLLNRGSLRPNSVDPIPQRVEGGLPDDRAESGSLLIDNIIDYNDRVDSTPTPSSSIKKWRGKPEKNSENLPVKHSVTMDLSEMSSTPEKPSPPFRSPPLPTDKNKEVFIKPTAQEVESYMQGQTELCSSVVTAKAQAQRFMNYYQSNGWKVGRHPMQDWQAAARNWLLNTKTYESQQKPYAQYATESPYESSREKDYSIPL
ncbi:helix-turn-helix domain-containing protein [Tunicatimonas pelagia]|uniref:helix-turn-helix domain-containing protein n=1 Tax=Tunicatimonas pelagia TaxID=931531 RepID=UPI002666C903|nr:helix-turn-helix domain-containing protein [Tunicatimonas pelagia]WKN43283.1 helix-turn-helix domain-containing protein [Tunicatimonas pelagia]